MRSRYGVSNVEPIQSNIKFSVSSSVMYLSSGYKLIKECSSGVQSECEKCSDGT